MDPDLQHDEFVAAYPGHSVADARDAGKPLGNELEECIACGMPEVIIDRLEVAEIETMRLVPYRPATPGQFLR